MLIKGISLSHRIVILWNPGMKIIREKIKASFKTCFERCSCWECSGRRRNKKVRSR